MTTPINSMFTITIDDDPIVPRTIESITGQKTLAFTSSDEFKNHPIKDTPTAVFIDIHLGLDENGIDLIPSIQTQWPYCPVIVVTTNPSGDAVGQALAAGAHDFLRKPFEPKELMARLRARSAALAEKACRDTVRFGDCVLDLNLNDLNGPDGIAHLSQSDARLLQFLVRALGAVVSREEIKRKLWGQVTVTDNALDKKLHDVRRAIKEVGSQVKLTSSYRLGFSLIVPSGPGRYTPTPADNRKINE